MGREEEWGEPSSLTYLYPGQALPMAGDGGEQDPALLSWADVVNTVAPLQPSPPAQPGKPASCPSRHRRQAAGLELSLRTGPVLSACSSFQFHRDET